MPSMASTSTQIASSSFSSTPSWRYDVFLSFHGKDTRSGFTDHLYAALIRRGILVFRDNERLEKGKPISDELLKAIQESKYGIAVISTDYASSKWCLNELAEMVKCMRKDTGRILPIFYHVDPSDVGNQRRSFAEAFGKHEKDPKVDIQMMEKWRATLREVSKFAGWHVVCDRLESIVVEEISRMILYGSTCNFSIDSKDFVGIESRVEEIMTLLSIRLDDVHFLGICGMGGIGKTTLSKAIYERVSHQFEASCFIDETRSHSLFDLQKQLISTILMDREINIWNSYEATRVIANRLRNKKVLIVLDNVDGEKQLKALAERHDWFGQGSIIIITSRDRHLLNIFVDNIYDVKVLNYAEALQLFSWKAFKKPCPEENYVQLSKDIVNCAQGLPLALEVFGSLLFGRTMGEWKSARDLLRKNPNAEILDKLKISYDGLEDLQQKMFLDIACFFSGAYIDEITYKLESFGYYSDFNMEVLVGKSLITKSEKRLQMHDLLQKMGQKIVHCESAEEPGERSRLWCNDDVIGVLKNSTGTDAVRGIVLKLPLQKQEQLNVEAFSKMKKLKMLQISSRGDNAWERAPVVRVNLGTVEWHGDASNFVLSNKLCVMEWLGYPCESLPTHFQSDNLVELKMRYSCIKQLWVGRNSFPKLKYIDLRHSQNLIETPDLSGVPNLQKLILNGCTSLSKVHPSIGHVRQLIELNLDDCSRLNKIPDNVGNLTSLQLLRLNGTAIKKIPLSFKGLTSLLEFNISNCSRLEKIPKNLLSGMKCLQWLYLGGSATRKLRPDPIISLLLPNSLSSLSSLIHLELSYCNLSDGAIPSDLSCLSLLLFLNLSGNKFTRIPDSVAQLPHLEKLDLSDCSRLQVLPKLPLSLGKLWVRNCPSLELFYKQMEMCTSNEKFRSIDCSALQSHIDYDGKHFKSLHLHPRSPVWWCEDEYPRFYYSYIKCGPASLVGSGIPEWFNDKSTNSSFGTIQLHSDLGKDGRDLFWEEDAYGTIQLHSDLKFRKTWGWIGYAVFIVYEFHEPHSTHPRKRRKVKVDERKGNSNSTTSDGTNSNFPFFLCHFQADIVDAEKPLVLCAPGVPSVGPNGFWVYIPAVRIRNCLWRGSLDRWISSLRTSITTGSLNVEVKECGARVVRDEHDYSELYQVLNTISPRGWDLQSHENIRHHMPYLHVLGPIIINKSKVVASGSIGSVNCEHLLKKSNRRKIHS